MSRHISVRGAIDAMKTADRHDRQPVLDAIELVKKYTYKLGNDRGVLTPPAAELSRLPLATLQEFCDLVDGLLNWAAKTGGPAKNMDLRPLRAFRRAELDWHGQGENIPSSGRQLNWKPPAADWGHAALAADDILNELKGRLTRDDDAPPEWQATTGTTWISCRVGCCATCATGSRPS
jgi:hypothetical protein